VSKVIVIDDEPFILMMIEDMLKKGEDSCGNAQREHPCAGGHKKRRSPTVILDWMMPELSGIELCKLIKNDPETSHIPSLCLQRGDRTRTSSLACSAV